MSKQTKTMAIVGGGASGLCAAIAACERAEELGRAVCVDVYEKDDRVGRSILATGNGRCNFSNSQLRVSGYRNADFVARAYAALGEEAGDGGSRVMAFLESCGLAWREEADGRRYPLANKASVVVDVLRAAAARLGARERCESVVRAVELPREQGKRFTLRMSDGVFQRADAVVVACGGSALESLDVEGLQATSLVPVLGPLRVVQDDIPFVRELDNIRVRGTVSLWRVGAGADGGVPAEIGGVVDANGRSLVAAEDGEVLFRKYGVSGICVFNLSRFAQAGDRLCVSFLPVSDADGAQELLRSRCEAMSRRYGPDLTVAAVLRGLVLPRVADALVKRAGIAADGPCDESALGQLAHALARCPLTVAGIGDSDICQVRRGGLAVEQFDPSTMGARGAQGLYAAGEALDVDGPCGGYNLHWAWASGLLAGRAAADYLFEG